MSKKSRMLTITLLGSLAISNLYNLIKIREMYPDAKIAEKAKELRHLMLTTDSNKPIVADVDDPIGILINNATEEDKQTIVEAINDMNEICPNLEYTLIDNDNIKLKNYINISVTPDISKISNNTDTLGFAEFKYNQKTAKIVYPMNIYLDSNTADIFDSEDGTSLMSYVVKHELLHTLGFKDLYEKEYLNKSIMFYGVTPETNITSLTEFDKNNLTYLYGDTKVTVQKPKSIICTPMFKHKDIEEMNI